MRELGMENTAQQTVMFRIESSKGMRRFYTLAVQPNLFGGYSLMRCWGQIGINGQMRIDFFNDEAGAIDACNHLLLAKQKRGYRQQP